MSRCAAPDVKVEAFRLLSRLLHRLRTDRQHRTAAADSATRGLVAALQPLHAQVRGAWVGVGVMVGVWALTQGGMHK
jgi:trehalose-6-phosphate synthase